MTTSRFILSKLILLIIICISSSDLKAQGVFGKWEVKNDAGRVNSIIEVYEENGIVQGKVIRITNEDHRDRKCTECPGELKDKPIEGLRVIRDFEKEGNEYVNGTLIDPHSGKQYKGKIWVDKEKPDQLNVRGYIAFFYKTKTWERAD